MKSIAVLAILMMLVGGIAAKGSRAHPIQQTSVAFGHCRDEGRAVSNRCRPVDNLVAGMVEADGYTDEGFWREYGGANVSDLLGDGIPGPAGAWVEEREGFWRELGGTLPFTLEARIDPKIFDPI